MIFRTSKITILILFVFFGLQNSFAQVELIGAIGSSHFLGDLGGKPTLGTNDISDLDIQTTRYALLAGARVYMGSKFALRGNISYARVAGDDKYTVNVERRGRNLNFFSNIFEGSAVIEFFANKQTGRFGRPGGLYLFGGIGYFMFEPKTKIDGEVVKLRPLGTEGQFYRDDLDPYDNHSMCIPFGIGYRFPLAGGGLLGVELNTRKTYTDYIDDVSTFFPDKNLLFQSNGALAVQASDRSISTMPGFSEPGAIRGDSRDMDTYFMFLITYSHPIGRGAGGYGGGVSGKTGRGGIHGKKKCPTF